MFGGYGLYQAEQFFGILLGGRVYFRTDLQSRGDYLERGMAPFTYTKGRSIVSQTYYEVPPEILENREQLLTWARQAIAAKPEANRKQRQKSRKLITCEICILAGGLSKRMGREKALLKIGGHAMLKRIEQTARQTGLRVRVIRRDCVPRCGPLGGILTALKSSKTEAALFLACDMPFVSVQLLERVMRALDHREAVFVRGDGEIGFPFILRRTVLPEITARIGSKQLSLHGLAAALTTRMVRLPRGVAEQLRNINTPKELEDARSRFEADARRRKPERGSNQQKLV